jgi:TorA maturation chaperone TorD
MQTVSALMKASAEIRFMKGINNMMQQFDMVEMKKFQHARGSVYFLLSRLFLGEPEDGVINRLADTEFFRDFQIPENDEIVEGTRFLQEFFGGYKKGERHCRLEELKLEYTRFFLGPSSFKSPPWESVYRSGGQMTFGKETLEVRNEYRKFGLSFKKKETEPDDHVGLELEFIYHLCKEAEEGFAQKDWEKVLGVLEAQRDFFDKHLNLWMPMFFRDFFNNAKTLFYKGMAKFTSGFLKWDYLLLLELIEELREENPEISRSN